MKNERWRSLLVLLLLLIAGGSGFLLLLRCDNKYTQALPAAPGINLLQEDPSQPAFLVDGWEYYPGVLLDPEEISSSQAGFLSVYVGRYPNFSEQLGSPFGEATYRLTLRNEGEPVPLVLYIPELLCAGKIYIAGTEAGELGSIDPYRPLAADGFYAFTAGEETEIVIQCVNYTHYYSGLYYPPAVGTAEGISHLVTTRLAVYGFLCFAPLAVALSNLALWAMGREKLSRRMGLLCLCSSLRTAYPFLHALGFPLVCLLYSMEDACGGIVLLCAMHIAGELSGAVNRWYHRQLAIPAAVGMCTAFAVFPALILPYVPSFINLYGIVLFIYKALSGAYLLLLAVRALRTGDPLSRFLLFAAGLYGLSLTVSTLTINSFEPARGAWPEEYGGFLLTFGFAALMVRRSILLSHENQRLTCHLQEAVDRRTHAIETLLAERRELLGSLIHDLKNPLAAVKSYAELVRSGGVALDRETAGYLDALTDRVGAIEERFSFLQSFSRGERGASALQTFSLSGFLREFYEDNRPDMELSGQSFHLMLCPGELFLRGDPERLRAALENLCYNALSFTPKDGTITLSLEQENGMAAVRVSDTGAGIAPEDLPHVFERGFTRRPEGEGMGLFIVRTITLEHSGTAEVSSLPGHGSVFTLRFPLSAPDLPEENA